jgi:hypothetical protein
MTNHRVPSWTTLAVCGGLVTASLVGGGCQVLEEIGRAVKDAKLPTAAMARVDLVQSPSVDMLLGYSCFTYLSLGDACLFAGLDDEKKKDMKFSFDVVFDMFNSNASFGIPLIEMLLGTTVFEDENLGALCVSFCDPEQEDCSVVQDAEEACAVDDADELDGASDLIPTVPDMLELAEDVVSGNFEDNFSWRTIPKYNERECQPEGTTCTIEELDGVPNMCCGDTCVEVGMGCDVGKNNRGKTCAMCEGHTEAHIQFDFNIDVFLGLMETLVVDAANDFLSGRNVKLKIPYTMDGTLFFDIPTLGRKALGFGPWDDDWKL